MKEPSGLLRTDGKRPDTVAVEDWEVRYMGRNGNRHAIASSYVPATSQTPGAATEAAADRKSSKYAILSKSYLFVPVTVETMGAINEAGMNFLGDLGRRITIQ